MKLVIKYFLYIFVLLGLTGCMTAQEIQSKYDNQAPSKICYDYFNLPDYNIWQGDREASIRRRGIDCTPFMAEALRNKRITEGLLSLGTELSKPKTYNTTATNLKTGFTKVCRYNGPGGPAAMTVPSASICPISMNINISGPTKVCYYDEMGGKKAITVKSTSICPISFPG
jgi:hypothetical protein